MELLIDIFKTIPCQALDVRVNTHRAKEGVETRTRSKEVMVPRVPSTVAGQADGNDIVRATWKHVEVQDKEPVR